MADYLDERWSHLETDETRSVIEKIRSILSSDNFHADPFARVQEWKTKRGQTEELRIPDDVAWGAIIWWMKKTYGTEKNNVATYLTLPPPFGMYFRKAQRGPSTVATVAKFELEVQVKEPEEQEEETDDEDCFGGNFYHEPQEFSYD